MDRKKSDLTLIDDKRRQDHCGFSRCFSLGAAMVLFWGGLMFLDACDSINGAKERGTMAMSKANSVPIPPIDASAPARMETATFALG